jgi:hypothetical protein
MEVQIDDLAGNESPLYVASVVNGSRLIFGAQNQYTRPRRTLGSFGRGPARHTYQR